MREFSFTVSKEEEGMAIKKILKRNFNFSSRLFARLKAQKRVFLNGIPLEGWMNPREGDRIVAVMPEEASHFPEEDIPVDPLYEDQDLLIINKPAGFTVHPTKGRPAHTMANGIQKYMRESGEKYKIRFVNRLDMDTSGILVIAKNSHAQDNLTGQMHTGEIRKYYQAIVIGNVEQDQFTIDLPIERSISIIRRSSPATLSRINSRSIFRSKSRIRTGRTARSPRKAAAGGVETGKRAPGVPASRSAEEPGFRPEAVQVAVRPRHGGVVAGRGAVIEDAVVLDVEPVFPGRADGFGTGGK